MVEEIISEKWTEAKCSECGLKFKYPTDSLYKPKTCGSFKCELKHQHPELSRRIN